jgi:putative ATP-dependent endonuclease of OLD family
LRNAEIVLIVEGEDDRKALAALLPVASKRLAGALQTGLLAVDTLNGGSNLSYKLGQLRDTLCICHSFLDYDKAGLAAAAKAENEGLALAADITHVICPGLDESEFEDMLDESIYAEFVKNKYGASLQSPKFKGKKKWSDRMKAAFEHQGKVWSPKLEGQVKSDLAELIARDPARALNQHKRGAFDGLVVSLDAKLLRLSTAS